jgi:hypothetical protein
VAVDRLRFLRFGRSRAELTTKAYAESVSLYLLWCRITERQWPQAARDMGLFMVWLKYTPSTPDGEPASVVLGPGAEPARRERRINGVLTAVRGLLSYAVRARDRGDQADLRRHLAQRRDEDQRLLRPDRALGAEAEQIGGEQCVDPRGLGQLRHPHSSVSVDRVGSVARP